MQRQRRSGTEPEMAVRRAAHALGLRYFVNRRPLPNLRRTADLVFPRAKVAVFVDGCFWHGCPEHGNKRYKENSWYWPEKIASNKRRDADTDRRLRSESWLPIRIWEHENPLDAVALIQEVVVARRVGNESIGRIYIAGHISLPE